MTAKRATNDAPRKMLLEREVLDIVPVARATLQRWIKAGTFPPPVEMGPNRIGWYADDIAAWQRSRQQRRV